jgi:hypothetical protein
MEIQQKLSGTQPPRIEAIEKAANDYVVKRDARMAAGKLESEAKKKLIKLCHDHGVTDLYEYEVEVELENGGKQNAPRVVQLTKVEKLRVGPPKGEEQEAEEED